MTVAFSSTGCQCGGTFTPSGCLMRMTNGEPFFIGSPDSTAHVKGPTNGFHSIFSGDVVTCSACGAEAAKAGETLIRHSTNRRMFMSLFPTRRSSRRGHHHCLDGLQPRHRDH